MTSRFLRFYLPCLLLFLTLLTLTLARHKKIFSGFEFLNDDTYVNLATARSMAAGEESNYPILQDGLWKILLTAMAKLFGDQSSNAHCLAMIGGVMCLTLLLALAWKIKSSGSFMLFIGILFVVAPGAMSAAVSGTSLLLASVFILASTLCYVKQKNPLPLSSAFFIAIAMNLRIELGIYWFVLCAHALIQYRRNSVYVLAQSASGLFILLLGAAPLVGWNLFTLGVPWPRGVGVPLAFDDWIAPIVTLKKSYLLSSQILPNAYTAVFSSSLFSVKFFVLVFVAASLWLFIAHVLRRSEHIHSIYPLAFLLLPLLYAIVYPYVGLSGMSYFFSAVEPLWLLVIAYGVDRLAGGLYSALGKIDFLAGHPLVKERYLFYLCAAFVLMSVMPYGGRELKKYEEYLNHEMERRDAVAAFLGNHLLNEQLVATDRPGWLSYRQYRQVVDLSGQWTPDVLRLLDDHGQLDHPRTQRWMKQKKVEAICLWSDAASIFSELPCEQKMETEGKPYLCRINWSAVP